MLEAARWVARPSLPCSVPTSLIQDASSRTLAPRALPIVPPSNECAWPDADGHGFLGGPHGCGRPGGPLCSDLPPFRPQLQSEGKDPQAQRGGGGAGMVSAASKPGWHLLPVPSLCTTGLNTGCAYTVGLQTLAGVCGGGCAWPGLGTCVCVGGGGGLAAWPGLGRQREMGAEAVSLPSLGMHKSWALVTLSCGG